MNDKLATGFWFSIGMITLLLIIQQSFQLFSHYKKKRSPLALCYCFLPISTTSMIVCFDENVHLLLSSHETLLKLVILCLAFTLFQASLLFTNSYVGLRIAVVIINQVCLFSSYLMVVLTWFVFLSLSLFLFVYLHHS